MRHDALQAKPVLRDGVELAIIGLGLDAPEAAAADVCQAGAEAVAQQAEQPEDDVTVGTRIGHDLRRLQFGLLFKHDRQQRQAVAERTGRRDRVEPGELIGEQVVPRHAFERAEVGVWGATEQKTGLSTGCRQPLDRRDVNIARLGAVPYILSLVQLVELPGRPNCTSGFLATLRARVGCTSVPARSSRAELGQSSCSIFAQVLAKRLGFARYWFGLFWLLGYRFSPRIADMGNSRLWRIDPKADYSPLNGVSRHRINADLILQHWDDLLRLAGSLKQGLVQATSIMRTLQVGDRPTKLA